MAEGPVRRNGTRRAVLGLMATVVAPASLVPLDTRAARTISRERDLPDFDRLVLQVPANVRIRIGSRSHARIEAEEKVIDRIAFRSDGRTLRVTASGSFQTEQTIEIELECRKLTALQAQASVDATLEGLDGKELELTAGDSATVNLERLNLQSLSADIGGSATVNASGKAAEQKAVVAGAVSAAGLSATFSGVPGISADAVSYAARYQKSKSTHSARPTQSKVSFERVARRISNACSSVSVFD